MPAKYKKRADGRYLIQIITGYKPDGKPQYKNVYANTIRELEEKAAKVRNDVKNGIFVKDEFITVRAYGEQWNTLYKSNKRRKTKSMYTTAFNHIFKSLGHMKIKDLKHFHVQSLINEIVSKGHFRTAEQVLLVISQVLERARKDHLVYENVAEEIEIPKHSTPPKRALTAEELSFINNADLSLKERAFLMLLLHTGIRRGEAIALNIDDIDFKNRVLPIRKKAIVVHNKMEIEDYLKTDAGYRTLPITDVLYKCLKEYLPTVKSISLFPTEHDKSMTETAFRRMWERIIDKMNTAAGGKKLRYTLDSFKAQIDPESNCKDPDTVLKLIGIVNNEKDNIIGIEKNVQLEVKGKYLKIQTYKLADDITPHLFRHTFATYLYYAGVDIKTTQYLLGHSDIKVTLEIYTHLEQQKLALETGKLNIYMNAFSQSEISQMNNTPSLNTAI